MIVSIGWRKDGEWKFGKVCLLPRALVLCDIMTRRTGVRHWPIPLCCKFDWTTVVEWPSNVEYQKSIKWNKYLSVKDRVVPTVSRKLKGYFRNLDYHEMLPTIEFECYTLVQPIKGTLFAEDFLPELIDNVFKSCIKLLKKESSDNKFYGSCMQVHGGMSLCETPESDLTTKEETLVQECALEEGEKNMTYSEAQVFNQIRAGRTEQAISKKMRVSQQRVNSLKRRAINKVMVTYKRGSL